MKYEIKSKIYLKCLRKKVVDACLFFPQTFADSLSKILKFYIFERTLKKNIKSFLCVMYVHKK